MTGTHVGEGCSESHAAQARAVVTRRSLLKGMLVGAGILLINYRPSVTVRAA